MPELRSPAGTVATAEGDLVDRLTRQGWVLVEEEKPARKPRAKKTED